MANFFLASELKQPNPIQALFHLVPVPYEASVSYGGGTAQGPAAIIRASEQLELLDQLGHEPWKQGIYTQAAIDCRGEPAEVMERIRSCTRQISEHRHIPFVLGGEHSVTFGAVMGVCDGIQEPVGIVQIDAHGDLRQEYQGSIWSHACVMKRLVDEGLQLVQLGVRAISPEEVDFREAMSTKIHYADAKNLCNPPRHSYALPMDFPQKIYLTVDIDGLDAALMPATGTPVPGGLGWWQLLDLIKDIAKQRQIVAMDLVEFAPLQGLQAYDFMAADLTYKMMGIVGQSRAAENEK